MISRTQNQNQNQERELVALIRAHDYAAAVEYGDKALQGIAQERAQLDELNRTLLELHNVALTLRNLERSNWGEETDNGRDN